jgi:hypothetical protein
MAESKEFISLREKKRNVNYESEKSDIFGILSEKAGHRKICPFSGLCGTAYRKVQAFNPF